MSSRLSAGEEGSQTPRTGGPGRAEAGPVPDGVGVAGGLPFAAVAGAPRPGLRRTTTGDGRSPLALAKVSALDSH